MSDGTPTAELVPKTVGPLAQQAPRTSGEIAARVFTLLDDGVTPVDVVVRTAASPEQVEDLWQTWACLRGLVLISPDGLIAVGDALRGRTPRTADQLMDAVKAYVAVEPRVCRSCGKVWAQYCSACPTKAAREARDRAAKVGPGRRPRRGHRSGSRK